MQDVVTASQVLESRNISHPARATEDYFVRNFKSARVSERRARHHCAGHALPIQWATIMGRKSWNSSSEVSCRRGIAAWEWLQVGHPGLCHNAGLLAPTLDSALFSRLVLPHMVLQDVRSGDIMASLSHGSWAVLFWPIDVCSRDANQMRTMKLRGPPASTSFGHVTDPSHWQVIPCQAERRTQGIVLQQTGTPDTLVRACLQQRHGLSHVDLARVAAYLETGCSASASRHALLNAIASKVSDGDPDFVLKVHAADQSPNKSGTLTLLMDPVFEAAYEEMPEDDKFEFPELRQERRRGCVRRHMADRQIQAVQRKRAVQGRNPLPQRRVRPRRGASPLVNGPGLGGAPAPASPPPLVAPGAADVPAALPVPLAAPAPAGLPLPAMPGAADVPGAVPAPALAAARAALGRVPRGEPWGRGSFIIARTHRDGELQSVTVTCLLHAAEGQRCNKNLNLGSIFAEAGCTQRIQEWCIRGLSIADGDGARAEHMASNPRRYSVDEVRSSAELEALANA